MDVCNGSRLECPIEGHEPTPRAVGHGAQRRAGHGRDQYVPSPWPFRWTPAHSASAVRDQVRQWVTEHWDPGRSLLEWRDCSSPRDGRCRRGRPMARSRPARPGPTTSPTARWPTSVRSACRPARHGLAAPTILTHGDDTREAPVAGADHHRRGHVVPAVQRARQRIRPGRPHRRPPDAMATSGSWTARSCGAPARITPISVCCWRRTNWDVPEAPRHHMLRVADAPAGRRGQAAASDERPRLVQRGLPYRRPHPRVRRHRPGRRRLARRADHPGPRAPLRWHAPPTLDRSRGSSAGAKPRVEADDYFRTYEWYPQRAGRVDLLIDRARATGMRRDAVVRQRDRRCAGAAAHAADGRPNGHRPPARWAGRRAPRARSASLGTSHVARAAAAAHSLSRAPTAC